MRLWILWKNRCQTGDSFIRIKVEILDTMLLVHFWKHLNKTDHYRHWSEQKHTLVQKLIGEEKTSTFGGFLTSSFFFETLFFEHSCVSHGSGEDGLKDRPQMENVHWWTAVMLPDVPRLGGVCQSWRGRSHEAMCRVLLHLGAEPKMMTSEASLPGWTMWLLQEVVQVEVQQWYEPFRLHPDVGCWWRVVQFRVWTEIW